MRVLAIVPARAGSKRVPGKNMRVLGGKPLAARAVDACLSAKLIATVCVSSDSEDVLALARLRQGVMAIQRPDAIAQDSSPAIDYVRHALGVLEAEGQAKYDAVAIVQPSSPFTTGADIDAAVLLLQRSPDADSAVTVMEVDHAIHPAKLKRLDGDRLMPYFEDERGRMASHELPKVFVRNCSVYVVRRRTVDEQRSVIGKDSRGWVMPRERSLDINDELDWQFACFLEERAR